MKELNKELIAKKEFKSPEDIFKFISSSEGTTTDIDFILRAREALVESEHSTNEIDAMLWSKLREHDEIKEPKTGMTMMLLAAHIGSNMWFDNSIENADLTATDIAGYNASFHAIIGGSLHIVKTLDSKGLEFTTSSKTGKPLLIDAASAKNPAIFEWMLDKESDDEVLKIALTDFIIHHDKPSIVQKMIGKNIDYPAISIKIRKKEALNLLEVALYKGHLESAKVIIEDKKIASPVENTTSALLENVLFESTTSGSEEIIKRQCAKLFIAQSIAENENNLVALVNASSSARVIKALFSIADINPALDINIDDYDDNVQDLIYEGMF